MVPSNKEMNILGVVFDPGLKWTSQLENVIKRANSARFAITMIAKYFNKSKLLNLISACYYSILYCNADIWMLPN